MKNQQMKKALKIIGAVLLGVVLIAVIAGFIIHQPMPEGEAGPEADALARKMVQAVNKQAWDSTIYVRWAFPGGHDYVWDKERGLVEVKWGDKRVILYTNGKLAKAWEGDQSVTGDAASSLQEKAWSYFCNDSFWLNAPVKAFDPGTTRSIVKQDDGSEALLVQYSSGGVTPGDAYLWLLDENAQPVAWRMWVNIIPIGGLKTSWEGWKSVSTGAKIATTHDWGILTVNLENIKGGNTLEAVGLSKDPFEDI